MHELWTGVLPRQVFADAPPAGFDAEPTSRTRRQLRELIARHADELAAVIVEPVVQGAGGMRFHSPAYLRVLREACDAHDVLLVFDEIATGFGRTGALFAAGARGRGAGCDVRGQGADRRLPDDGGDAVHARGWPRASRAARSRCSPTARPSWATRWPRRRLRLDRPAARARTGGGGQADRGGLRDGLAGRATSPGVRDVRVLGAIGVVQLDHEVDMAAATRAAVARGRVAAAVPRPRLHDAAVRHRRRRRGTDRAGGVRGGTGGMSMSILVITGTGTEVGKTIMTAAVAAAALAADRRWPC